MKKTRGMAARGQGLCPAAERRSFADAESPLQSRTGQDFFINRHETKNETKNETRGYESIGFIHPSLHNEKQKEVRREQPSISSLEEMSLRGTRVDAGRGRR